MCVFRLVWEQLTRAINTLSVIYIPFPTAEHSPATAGGADVGSYGDDPSKQSFRCIGVRIRAGV